MELLLEGHIFSGLKEGANERVACCLIPYPTGRHRLQVVREGDHTKIQVGQNDELLCPNTFTHFRLLLLTLAQRAHFSEAVWLLVQ